MWRILMMLKNKILVIRISIALGILIIIATVVFYNNNPLNKVIYKGNLSPLENVLISKQLEKLSSIELRILRNTIYAKYGYDFSATDLYQHFSQFQWYKPLGKNIDNQLKDIDKTNVNLIMYYENNVNNNDSKKPRFVFTNPFKKITETIAETIERPKYDIEIRLSKNFYNSKLYKSFLNFEQLPLNLSRDIITDGNFTNNNFDKIFIGFNFNINQNNSEYIVIANFDTKTNTISNSFRNFNLQKDNYNEEIYSMNYKYQNLFLYSKNNQLFISTNKNMVFQAANTNAIIKLQHKGEISINISNKFTNLYNMAFGTYTPNINIEYLNAYLEETEKYKLIVNIICSDKNTAEGIYEIFSGLKQTSNGVLKLYSENLPMIIPDFMSKIVFSSLADSNIKQTKNTVNIEFDINKNLIDPLLTGL
jgi:hypothetical protein